MTITDCVFETLTTEGRYKSLQQPLKIGSQEFYFTHILAATERGKDLVLVIELTNLTSKSKLVRSILALARALDVYGSRRSLTVIFASGQADKELINAINRVCRVLPIGSQSGVETITHVRDWLAVLLPLRSPPPVEHLADWRSALKERLDQEISSEMVRQFILRAEIGQDAVEQVLAEEIASRSNHALEDGEAG